MKKNTPWMLLMKLPTDWAPAFIGDDLKEKHPDKVKPACLKCLHCTHFGVFLHGCNGLPIDGPIEICDKYEEDTYDLPKADPNFKGEQPNCIGCQIDGKWAPADKKLKAVPGKKCTYCYKK